MSDLLYLVNETRELMLEVEDALTGDHDPQSIEHGAIAALALRHLHERRLELADADDDGPAELAIDLERPLLERELLDDPDPLLRVRRLGPDEWGFGSWHG